jgi:hypothetical protein
MDSISVRGLRSHSLVSVAGTSSSRFGPGRDRRLSMQQQLQVPVRGLRSHLQHEGIIRSKSVSAIR